MNARARQDEPLIMGRIAGPYGVRGWLRVTSYTELVDSLLDYQPWYLRRAGTWQAVQVLEGRVHGKGLVVQLEYCADREGAQALAGSEIGIYRSQLPAPGTDEYYWSDLVGLRVFSVEGRELGIVDHLIETGANDVLVVRGETEVLVPYIREDVIREVDLEHGIIRVDWNTDY